MSVISKHKELDIYFKNADHIDVKTIEGDTDLRSFISGMLSYCPWWMVSLYRVREIIVRILGLVRHEKPETAPSIKPEDLSFKPGEIASFFIVRDAKDDTYHDEGRHQETTYHLSVCFQVGQDSTGKFFHSDITTYAAGASFYRKSHNT